MCGVQDGVCSTKAAVGDNGAKLAADAEPAKSFDESTHIHPAEAWECLLLPDEELLFDGDEASLEVHNISDSKVIAFCVFATSADAIEASPDEGCIPPKKHIVIHVRLLQPSLPERLIIRCAAVPPLISEAGVAASLDALFSEAQAGSTMCTQHLLRCSRTSRPPKPAEAERMTRVLNLWRVGATQSMHERLAAAERLALLRTTQLLHAEHRIVALTAAAQKGQAPPMGEGVHPQLKTHDSANAAARRHARRAWAMLLVVSHILVALVAVCLGAFRADDLIGA